MYKKTALLWLLVSMAPAHSWKSISYTAWSTTIEGINGRSPNKDAISETLNKILTHPLNGFLTTTKQIYFKDHFLGSGYHNATVPCTQESLRRDISYYYEHHKTPYLQAYADLKTLHHILKLLSEDSKTLCNHLYDTLESVENVLRTIRDITQLYHQYTHALKTLASMPEYIDATTPS